MEWARIAREMHDSVAHHLTVIVALSDGALAAVTRAPDQASDAIRGVSSTAREALAETRSLLGILRAEDGLELRQPLPGLSDLEGLFTGVAAMFEDAVQRGVIPVNPARRVKIAKQVSRDMRILSHDEYRRVLRYLDPAPKLLARLAVASGARWGELAEFRGADLTGSTLTIARNVAELKNPQRFQVQPTPKNGKTRRVKIPPQLAAEVRAHATGPGELLFPGRHGGHQRCAQFRLIWQRAQKAAGITPPARVHDLRHMALSWWLADGMPLATVRDRAGHGSLHITSRHVHAIDDAEDEALGRSLA